MRVAHRHCRHSYRWVRLRCACGSPSLEALLEVGEAQVCVWFKGECCLVFVLKVCTLELMNIAFLG